MIRVLVFSIVLAVYSCQNFTVKKTTTEAILNDELKAFNWNEVDEYPSFSACDSLTQNEAKRLCFSNTLALYIQNYLKASNLSVTKQLNDTIHLKFKLSEAGKLDLSAIALDSLTNQKIPDIENLIKRSLDSLPKIYPAIKRGQHVKTEFDLPIIITAN